MNYYDGDRCALLRCGDARPLATALGAARTFARRPCGSLAACPARCVVSDGVCAPKPAPEAPRRVHVLSMGRVGSSHVLKLLDGAGLRTIFEPLGGTVEGGALLGDRRLGDRLRCLYDCDAPCSNGVTLKAGPRAAVSLLCAERTYAMKTTRVLDLGAIAAALTPRHLRETRFVLLLRDPRGVWASVRDKTTWAIRSSHFVCRSLDLQHADQRGRPWQARRDVASQPPRRYATAPRLSAAGGALLVLFYEKWARDEAGTACALARWIGRATLPRAWRGSAERRAVDVGNWRLRVPPREIADLEENDACRRYMAAAGYVLSNAGDPVDYRGLRPPPLPGVAPPWIDAPVDGCPGAP